MSYFTHLLVGTSLLLLAAVIVSLVYCRMSASFRCKIWHVTIIALILLPLVMPFLPRQMLGLVPYAFTPPPQKTLKIDPVYLTEDIQYFPVVEDEWKRFCMEDQRIVEIAERETVTIPQPVSVEQTPFSFPSVSEILIGLWITGTLVLVFRLFFSLLAARRLLGRMLPVENKSIEESARNLMQRMRVRRPVTLLQSEAGTVPFTLGIRKPKIVLPRMALENWEESQLRTILTHEIAHVQRRDVWGQLLVQFAFCLYWFHPFIWLAARQIRISRELACDDMVLLNGESATDFASILLELVHSFPLGNQLVLGCGVGILERQNIVRQRITSILNKKAVRTPIGRIGGTVLFLLAIAGVAFASVVSPFEKFDSVERNMRELRRQLPTLQPTPTEKAAIKKLRQNIFADHSLLKQESQDTPISLEFRFLTVREPFGAAILANKAMEWTGLPFPEMMPIPKTITNTEQTGRRSIVPNLVAATPPGLCSLTNTVPLPLHVRFMEETNMVRFHDIFQKASYANILQAPKITFFSKEPWSTSDTSERYFVTSVIPVEGDEQTAYQPVIQIFREGTQAQGKASLLEDRSCRIDSCIVEFATIDDDVKIVKLCEETGKVYGFSQNSDIVIQVPKIRSICISIPEIVIPEGMSMLVAVPGIAESLDTDLMFLMIRPSIID